VLWWLIPGHLGVPITVLGHGVLLPVILVAVIAVGGVSNVADAAMIGLRESRHLLVKNTAGSIAKLIDLPLLVGLGAGGLFAATVSANVVASAIAFGVLSRVLLAPRRSIRVADMARVRSPGEVRGRRVSSSSLLPRRRSRSSCSTVSGRVSGVQPRPS
jgi:hypothetical protein